MGTVCVNAVTFEQSFVCSLGDLYIFWDVIRAGLSESNGRYYAASESWGRDVKLAIKIQSEHYFDLKNKELQYDIDKHILEEKKSGCSLKSLFKVKY